MLEYAGKMCAKPAVLVLAIGVLCLWALAPVSVRAENSSHLIAVVLKDLPPLYMTDEEGNQTGFAVDVLKEVAAMADIRYEILPVQDLAEALNALESGRGDFIPGIGVSEARRERFIFTDTFEAIPIVCFVRSDTSDINSFKDLPGRRTAVLDRSTAQTELGLNPDIRITPYHTIDEALFSLLAGNVDALVIPEPILMRKAREIGVGDQIKVVGEPFMEVKRGYMLRRDETWLRDRLNKALRVFVGSPRYNEIFTKWWTKPRPFWTINKVAATSTTLLIVMGIILGFWRYRSVAVLNRELQKIMEERLQAQARLEASEKRLNRAQELTTVGSFERDLLSGEGFWSDALFSILGYPPGENSPPVEDFLQQIHPDDRPGYLKGINTSDPESPTQLLEFRFKPIGSDEYRYGTCLFTFEFDANSTPVKRVGAIQDITDRKIIEEQLREAKEKAETASLAKSEFLANMSHELRTPLNGAMGMLQLMDMDTLDPEHQDYAKTALASCRSLTTLINDILDLSKVEANKMALSMIDFNPEELLDSVRSTFHRLAEDKNIKLIFDIGDLPECVVGDPARLRQVLFNLVGNATKFTETGAVTVEASRIHGNSNGMARLLFTVRDTGIGIPDHMVDKVFGAFTQVDGAYTRRFQGTGLGLHIVKRLVQLMGGNLSIESQVDKGTAVHVALSFMVVDRPKPIIAPIRGSRRISISPKHILIVEDERVNMLTISRFVERLGHTFSCASNGLEALNLLANEDVDLVLMDVQMPVMNGIEATRAIRSTERWDDAKRNVPIIALTAHAMSGDRENFLDEGMNDYIAKPISLMELQSLLEGYFRD